MDFDFFDRNGRINSHGNFDRRYARGWGRTSRQTNADVGRSFRVRGFDSIGGFDFL